MCVCSLQYISAEIFILLALRTFLVKNLKGQFEGSDMVLILRLVGVGIVRWDVQNQVRELGNALDP